MGDIKLFNIKTHSFILVIFFIVYFITLQIK